MAPLKERLEFVMREAGFDPSPEAEKRREFARHCDFPSNSETLISNILTGRRPAVDELTARRIGKATNFSWWWLKTGEGEERPYEGDRAPPRSTALPVTQHALEVALEYWPERWSEPTVGAAMKLQFIMTPQQWTEKLDEIEKALKSVASQPSEAPVGAVPVGAKLARDFHEAPGTPDSRTASAMTLGARLKIAREMRKLTVEDLAEMTGDSAGYIEQLEAGTYAKPKAAAISRLADALKIKLKWLRNGAEPMETAATSERAAEKSEIKKRRAG